MGGRTERRAGRGNGNGDGQSANVAPTMSGPSNPHRFCSCLAQAMPAGPSSRVHRVGKGGVYVRRRSTFIGDATDQDKAPVAIAAIDEAFVGVDFEPYARVAERRIGEAVAGRSEEHTS